MPRRGMARAWLTICEAFSLKRHLRDQGVDPLLRRQVGIEPGLLRPAPRRTAETPANRAKSPAFLSLDIASPDFLLALSER